MQKRESFIRKRRNFVLTRRRALTMAFVDMAVALVAVTAGLWSMAWLVGRFVVAQ